MDRAAGGNVSVEIEEGMLPSHLRRLAAVFRASPELNERMTQALQRGAIDRWGVIEGEGPSAAHFDFDGDVVRFRRSSLEVGSMGRVTDGDKLTVYAGHEVEHGLRAAGMRMAHSEFSAKLQSAASQSSGPRDYTSLVVDRMGFFRNEEAVAMVAGVNALASKIENEGGPLTKETLASRLAPVMPGLVRREGNQLTLANGIEFDPDTKRVTQSLQSRTAIAEHFFDRNGYRTQNYAQAIGEIARRELPLLAQEPGRRSEDIYINLRSYRVTPEGLAKQPLDFGGEVGTKFTFRDSGQPGAPLVTLVQNVESRSRSVNLELEGSQAIDTMPPRPGNSSIPENPLYAQIKSGVERLDAESGRTFDSTSQRLAASLYRLAREEGLERVDHVVLGTPAADRASQQVFLVRGDLRDPAHLRAQVGLESALTTPETVSLQQAAQIDPAQSQRQSVQQDMDRQQQRGPVLP